MTAAGPDERARVEEVRRYRALAGPGQRELDRIVSVVAATLGVPMALVTFVDEHHQWFQACFGIAGEGTSREVSFCQHTIRTSAVFTVADAHADPRFVDNPLVTGAPHIRAYAGAPLRTPSGHHLGALCAVDTEPRTFTDVQLDTLVQLAAMVVDELELRLAREELAIQNFRLQAAVANYNDQTAKLAAQSRVMLAILESAGEGIAVTDERNRLVFFNPAAQRMLGYGPADQSVRAAVVASGMFRADGVTPIAPSDAPAARALRGDELDEELCIRRGEGRPDLFIHCTARPLREDEGAITGSVVTFVDITPLRAARDELARQATTDALTGIANHRAFRARLDTLVAEGQRGRRFALVICDVDHFKRFNDEHGHQTGDRVLAAVAARLDKRVRATDLAARYGGEEFAVLLVDVDEERAEAIAEELRAAVEGLGLPQRVTASFGVAVYGADGDGNALIAAADAALYRAKQLGRNRVALASAGGDAEAGRDGDGARGGQDVRVHHRGARDVDGILRLVELAGQDGALEGMLTQMCAAIAGIAAVDVASVYVRQDAEADGGASRLVMRGNHGFPAEAIGNAVLAIGEGITGLVAECMRPVSAERAAAESAYKHVPGLGEERFPVFLGVPLVSGGAVLGVLVMQRQARPFGDREVALATALAGPVTLAIERRRAQALRSARLAGLGRVPGVVLGRAGVVPTSTAMAAALDEAAAGDARNGAAVVERATQRLRDDLGRAVKRLEGAEDPQVGAALDRFALTLVDARLKERLVAAIGQDGGLRAVSKDYARAGHRLDDHERASEIEELCALIGIVGDVRASAKPGAVWIADGVGAFVALAAVARGAAALVASGRASAVAVAIASAARLPLVDEVAGLFGWVRAGDLLAVDGVEGSVLVHPAPSEIERLRRARA